MVPEFIWDSGRPAIFLPFFISFVDSLEARTAERMVALKCHFEGYYYPDFHCASKLGKIIIHLCNYATTSNSDPT